MPDGEWSFEDWIDDDGVDYGKPIRLFVTFRKRGDSLVADWTGTSPQPKGAITNTLSFTKAATYTALKSVLSYDVPCNAGFYRAIDVIAPPGTIANGVLPAASAARGLTGFRMIDTCFGALAQMLPQRSIAASEGGNTGISIGGYDPQRKPFIFVEFICSAWGGRAWSDGLDGNANLMANMSLPPVEITEAEQPLQILCTEFIQDVGGPGKFRGGASIRRDYKLLEEEAVLQVRADRHDFRPYGLFGGSAGRPSRNTDEPGHGEPSTARQVHDDDEARRRLQHRVRGPGRLGRSAGARARACRARRPQRVREPAAPRRRLRCRLQGRRLRSGRGRDGCASRRAAREARLDRGAGRQSLSRCARSGRSSAGG